MPRSSRHKSSKHSSRDAREYSDSEKESSLKERKGKEESSARVSKESGSSDKRKHDSKDNKEYYDSANGEYFEEYTSAKRRKEKIEDGVSDRWNGGDEDRGEGSKKSKASSEKSRRRDEVEGEETKKSSGKNDGKHRESCRRESREFDKERDRDRDRKYKEGRSEKFYDSEDHHGSKGVTDKTDLNAQDQLQSMGSEHYLERRARRKRDEYGDGEKQQDSVDESSNRLLASRDDNVKDGRQKEEKYKDEKYRDKYWEDIDKDNKHRSDKQRDDRPGKEHTNIRSDEKLLREEKDASESKRKKSKLQENDHDHGHEPDSEHDGYRGRPRDYERNRDYEREYDRGRDREREHDRDQERDRDRVRDHERDRDRDRDRDHERERDRDRGDYERDRYHERDWDRGRSRDRDWDHDRDRNRDRERDRSRDYYYDRERSKTDRERDLDRDVSHLDDQSGRYKDGKERRRSPDDHDDLSDSKSRAISAHNDAETRSSKAHPDSDRIRSQSRQPSSSHVDQEEFGHISDQRSRVISSREAADLSGGSERVSKYRSEKSMKMEDGHLGELLVERSSSTKASPRGLVERSPSSTSLERRYMNRSGARRSLEVEETGQRSNAREFSASEDRLSRDLPSEKPLGDESSLGELTSNNKANQNNPPLLPRPESWGGIGSPLVGSLEEDNRVNVSGRYKRGGDPNMGRGQGNTWRSAPNWPSPVPNGFIPFQHGPPHGGFQSMMPQFPSPSLFGVRPSMEMSHSGMPYHMSDAERFSGHLRPLGWQNMMDGSGPSHMHGWDMGNGPFRDDPHMYGGAEWDHSRRMHGRGWGSGADAWKTQNGDASMDVSSMSLKDDSAQAADDDVVAGQPSHSESNRAKSVEAGSNLTSPAKELPMASPKFMVEEASDHPAAPTMNDIERYCRYYLSKLDISVELADTDLHSECTSLVTDEQSAAVDKGTAVLVNLKGGGKAVPKRDYSSLVALSLFPITNNTVSQRAMDLYKELRVETKGLSAIEDEGPGVRPSSLDKVDGDGDENDPSKGNSPIPTSDVKISNASGLTSPHKSPEAVLPTDADKETDKRGSAPDAGDSSEAVEAPQDAEPDPEGDEAKAATAEQSIPEEVGGDRVPLSAAADVVAGEGERNNGRENESGEKAEEEEGCGGGVVVMDASGEEVYGPLIPESRESESESVISRIHQSTH